VFQALDSAQALIPNRFALDVSSVPLNLLTKVLDSGSLPLILSGVSLISSALFSKSQTTNKHQLILTQPKQKTFCPRAKGFTNIM